MCQGSAPDPADTLPVVTPRHVSPQLLLRGLLRSSPHSHLPRARQGGTTLALCHAQPPTSRATGAHTCVPRCARAQRRLRARTRPPAPALFLMPCHFHQKLFTRHFSPHWYSRRALAVLAHRLLKEILRRSVAGVTFQPAPSRFPKSLGSSQGRREGGAGSGTSQLPPGNRGTERPRRLWQRGEAGWRRRLCSTQ